MASNPTITIPLVQAVNIALARAEKTQRTQQIELDPNLYARVSVAAGQRRFLLFRLEGLPEEHLAQDLATALGFGPYALEWFEGNSVRSLVVQER
jgi:hypothetical protein